MWNKFLIVVLVCQGNFSWAQKTSLDLKILPKAILESRIHQDSSFNSFYVLNFVDTVYFKDNAIFWCNFMKSTGKLHNKCCILSFGEPVSGQISYSINSIHTFSGILENGYIVDGFEIGYFDNGKIKRLGQYRNNEKSGLWTQYHESGTISFLWKYISGIDFPVTEWEFDTNGKLIHFQDEEPAIRELLLGKPK